MTSSNSNSNGKKNDDDDDDDVLPFIASNVNVNVETEAGDEGGWVKHDRTRRDDGDDDDDVGDDVGAVLQGSGDGDSEFIEALARDGERLGISKDQLAGFTKDVEAYALRNCFVDVDQVALRGAGDIQVDVDADADAEGGGNKSMGQIQVCLVDTPGFSDTKISEVEIIQKIKMWMDDNGVQGFNHIFYMWPITDTRVSGSKRRTMRMMQELLERPSDTVTIITTMWDQLHTPQARARAEARYAELQGSIIKDLRISGICKFDNNKMSAIEVIENAILRKPLLRSLSSQPLQRDTKAAVLLYQELMDHIDHSRQTRVIWWDEWLALQGRVDANLEADLVQRFEETDRDIYRSFTQLVGFGRPPDAEEFRGMPQRLFVEYLKEKGAQLRCEAEALERALDGVEGEGGVIRSVRGQRSLLRSRLDDTRREIERLEPYIGSNPGTPLVMSQGYDVDKLLQLIKPKKRDETISVDVKRTLERVLQFSHQVFGRREK
ncbi:hypothetical protein CVT24_002599 [Panaeolus cyanescens]|uniref:G domain-containing protein n=1 Tax=Panaeolus cyanescens TaxID=181874 RepID=A0A409WB45_9AGAR|nr:hypothetical protein CVT24_002599 [Panaeolus cyanescens]